MSMQGTWCDALFVQAVADCQNVAIDIIESQPKPGYSPDFHFVFTTCCRLFKTWLSKEGSRAP